MDIKMEMISAENAGRIAQDARIAADVLMAIDGCHRAGGALHTSYLMEKVECAQRCLDFMKRFYEVRK